MQLIAKTKTKKRIVFLQKTIFTKKKSLNANQTSKIKKWHLQLKKKPNKAGLVDKNFILNKINNTKLNISQFYLQDVKGDGNCGYRCISLQLYGNENEYTKIRNDVYSYLNSNRNQFIDFNFEYNG